MNENIEKTNSSVEKIDLEKIKYLKALDTVDYEEYYGRGDDIRNRELAEGMVEIIDDAKLGRRARTDLASSEQSVGLSELELKNTEKDAERERKEKDEEERLIRKIQKKYKEIFDKEKGEDA